MVGTIGLEGGTWWQGNRSEHPEGVVTSWEMCWGKEEGGGRGQRGTVMRGAAAHAGGEHVRRDTITCWHQQEGAAARVGTLCRHMSAAMRLEWSSGTCQRNMLAKMHGHILALAGRIHSCMTLGGFEHRQWLGGI